MYRYNIWQCIPLMPWVVNIPPLNQEDCQMCIYKVIRKIILNNIKFNAKYCTS